MNLAATWLRRNGWKAFDFQKEVWQAVADGQSGLVHASTGAGKTYAVWLAALNRFAGKANAKTATRSKRAPPAAPLTVLWITPMPVSYTHLTLPTILLV